MRKKNFKKIGVLILSFISLFVVFFGICNISNTKAEPSITVDNSSGISIYVSGQYVEKLDSGTYFISKKSDVTLSAINEYKIFKSFQVTIDGVSTTYDMPVVTLNLNADSKVHVEVDSVAATSQDKGLSFSDPYILSTDNDFIALENILNGTATNSEFNSDLFSFASLKEAQETLRYAYFKITNDLLIDRNEYYGLGSHLIPFQGCIDFNDHNISLNIYNSNYATSFNNTNEVFNSGFFGTIMGDDSYLHPCIIRNLNVKGSISYLPDDESTSNNTMNIGGVAGKVSNNVLFENIISSVSISIFDNCNINAGGLFGCLNTSIDSWSNLSYAGIHSTINAITNGEKAFVNVGGLAGLIENAYCKSYEDQSFSATYIGNSLNASSGNSSVGGIIGKINHSITLEYLFENFLLHPENSMIISSIINNTSGSEANYASASSGIGSIQCSSGNIRFSPIVFKKNEHTTKQTDVLVTASTSSAYSYGNVYAGGIVGYIDDTTANNVYFDNDLNLEEITIFEMNVEINAIQNGYNQAYAGGIFGYNAFQFLSTSDKVMLNLNHQETKININAVQSSLSSSVSSGSIQPVSAGYYTAVLTPNSSIQNLELTIFNSSVSAKREVSSKTIGPVYAGSLAGIATGNNKANEQLKNITINLVDSSIHALELSYNALKLTNNYDTLCENNLGAGGFIGYLKNYGNSQGMNVTSNIAPIYPGIENIQVNITLNQRNEEDAIIQGIQNAISGDGDNHTEGYVGGIIGYCRNSYLKNVNIASTNSKKALITLNLTNNPNTAAIGGLVGNTYLKENFSLDGGMVENIRVYGNAYYDGTSDDYDLFVGGAIGVLGLYGSNAILKDVFVLHSTIESFGDNNMITYAGGIAGGVWWSGTGKVYNCGVINSEIYSHSIFHDAYASGIVSLIQDNTTIDSCFVLDTFIFAEASTVNRRNAYVAGISSRVRNVMNSSTTLKITNCISNATLFAKSNAFVAGIMIKSDNDNSFTVSNCYFDPFHLPNVEEGSNLSDLRAILLTTKVVDSTGVYPLSIYNPNDNFYSSLSVNDDDRYSIYSYVPSSISSYSLSISLTDESIASIHSFNEVNRMNSIDSGTTFANLEIYIPHLNKNYTICSYPIYVNDVISSEFSTINEKDGVKVSKDNTETDIIQNGYYLSLDGTDEYIKVEVGHPLLVQNVIVQFKEDLNFSNIEFYNPLVFDNEDLATRINNIKNSKGNKTNITQFLGLIDIDYFSDSIILRPNMDLEDHVILLLVIGNKNLILDYIPNYVTSIEISPSVNTPYLAKLANNYYIYAEGDTVNFEAKLNYKYPSSSLDKKVQFSGTSSYANIYSNGRVIIHDDAAGQTIDVICNYIGTRKESSISAAKATIEVRNSIEITTELLGSSFTSLRKAVHETEFEFAITPSAGYGFNPDLLEITIGTKTFSLANLLGYDKNQDIALGTISVDGQNFDYSYFYKTGTYTIIIPKEALVDTSIKNIHIKVVFPNIYNLVFDKGGAYVQSNDRYFIYTLKTGTILDEDLYVNIQKNIYISKFGYELKGYYLTDKAISLDTYGEEFYDICHPFDGIYRKINGPMHFYARWTYDVAVEAPAGIKVKSSFPLGLLEENVNGQTQLIPIHTNNSFSFTITKENRFAGKPDFQVFILHEDMTFKEITSYCQYNPITMGYDIDPNVLDGMIFIKVFSDNLIFNNGEVSDTNIMNNDVYEDGVYTLQYSINYAENGVKLSEAAFVNNITFTFENELPENTSIRLYRQVNQKPIDVGEYVLNTALKTIQISDFKNIYTSSAMYTCKDDESMFNGFTLDSIIFSETYYLVITPPLFYTSLEMDTFHTKVRVNAQYNDDVNTLFYGKESEKFIQSNNRPIDLYQNAMVDYSIYKGYQLTVTMENHLLTFQLLEPIETQIEDIRHKYRNYLWRIECSSLQESDLELLDNTFSNFVCKTSDALYYLATSGQTLDVFDILQKGYSISLLEVNNPQVPGSEIVLWNLNEI